MAEKTGLGIDPTMFLALVVAMTNAAGDVNAIHFGVEMTFVGKTEFFIFHRPFG